MSPVNISSARALVSGSGQLWNPSNGAKPSGWWDFSQASSVTLNGSSVSSIADLSGNNNTLSQSNASNQPYYLLKGLNALNVASFDGATSFLANTTNSSIYKILYPSGTIFVVQYSPNDTQLSCTIGIMGVPLVGLHAPYNNTLYLDYGSTTSPNHMNPIAITSGITTVGWHVFGGAGTANSTGYFYRDSVRQARSLSPNLVTVSSSNLYLGCAYSSSPFQFFNGKIAEVVLYNTQLSTPNRALRQTVEGYLCWKWGIQSVLPTLHPYYRAAPKV